MATTQTGAPRPTHLHTISKDTTTRTSLTAHLSHRSITTLSKAMAHRNTVSQVHQTALVKVTVVSVRLWSEEQVAHILATSLVAARLVLWEVQFWVLSQLIWYLISKPKAPVKFCEIHVNSCKGKKRGNTGRSGAIVVTPTTPMTPMTRTTVIRTAVIRIMGTRTMDTRVMGRIIGLITGLRTIRTIAHLDIGTGTRAIVEATAGTRAGLALDLAVTQTKGGQVYGGYH